MKENTFIHPIRLVAKLDLQFFAETMAADLINPEVLADAVSAKLPDAIKFTPYATVDNTLVGQPGDTITRPKYGYIGPAEDLVEGVPMDTTKLSMTDSKVTVKEAGKAVEVTEKAVITNVNGTLAEAERQIVMSLADKVEIDYVAALNTAVLTHPAEPTTATAIIDAKDVFGDEDDEQMVLFIHPKDYTKLVKSFFNAGGAAQEMAIAKGQVAELVGVRDIQRSRRIAEGTAYLQKIGAVEIVNKKRVTVKTGEDILKRTFVIAGNAHYATNLFNDNGVVKITAGAGGE